MNRRTADPSRAFLGVGWGFPLRLAPDGAVDTAAHEEDIRESIRELAYYRQAVFVPEPGPTSDGARAAAASVVSSYASGI